MSGAIMDVHDPKGNDRVEQDAGDDEHGAVLPDLLDLLCCPKCRGDLAIRPDDAGIDCPGCAFTFPIVDGIPVMFPMNVKEKFDNLFDRHWDSEEMADLYNHEVEGQFSEMGMYVHVGERDATMNVMATPKSGKFLDCGCGNGRFFKELPEDLYTVGVDASLNLLRIVKRNNLCPRLVCCELEHLPFKDDTFETVLSVRVIQHIHDQYKAVSEITRVCRPGGDVILHLYNDWCTKALVKKIRESRWGETLNIPFKLFFKSLRPFSPWPIAYDKYNNAPQVKRWLRRENMHIVTTRGAGLSFNKWFLNDFWIVAVLEKRAPKFLERYLALCLVLEERLGAYWPLNIFMEKFVIKAGKPDETG
jgi:ubiquinone/menaquinone biosynthesis C-methylase UbiE/uncharacterized protein YbaR (Trm112 family)